MLREDEVRAEISSENVDAAAGKPQKATVVRLLGFSIGAAQ